MSYRAITRRTSYIDSRLRHTQDYPSATDLARELREEFGEDVTPRTIQRDIDKMRDRGAPVEYDPARHGYFYTDRAWQLPALNLTEGDLLALMVGDRALEGYQNSPYYDELRSVFERLTDLLPEKVSIASRDLIAQISVIADPVTRIDTAVWESVREGLYRNRTIAIHYHSPGRDDSVVRIVDPLHLVGHRGEWYLLCWSHHHQSVRIYALFRIKEARVRDETFSKPEKFCAAEYIDPSFGVFINEEAVEIVIRFDGEAARMIPERQWHREQKVENRPDGSIILRFRTNQQSQVLFWVSQWGPGAEILEPPELRERARQWFSDTAERYHPS
ncbi:transcriptional regulator [Alkalispirochaeta sphaeroplastigenens]|uniref:Transcriptional regulator n=1 Tax=Alkalispirochaeta sphaeroplastigenens TaxID=1187066 RepID=A0A2S4JFF8_9SPIO|nr:transcriptional regulator [Alkalispirochaeta sphaeroplastigenens]POQ98284.1 transcriptional regulator [Alkalispirochaeta sphaeroplastigenens]